MTIATVDRRTCNPCHQIGLFGLWLGRKITRNPKKIEDIVKFVRGAATFPFVWIGNKAVKTFVVVMKPIEEMPCPEELVKEVTTFSLSRRISAPIAMFVVTLMGAVGEELIFRNFLQETCLKQGVCALLEPKPQAVELLSSKKGTGSTPEEEMPSAVKLWVSKKGKSIRVIVSTCSFAMAHLVNSENYPLLVIPLGFAASVLQEEYGTCAAIGVHVINNIVGSMEMLPFMLKCYLQL